MPEMIDTPRPNGGRRPFPPELKRRRYTIYATDDEWRRIVQTVPRFADIRPGADPNTYRKARQKAAQE